MVKRYIQGDACSGEYRCDVEPNDKGNLVEYWEYELLEEKNKELRDELKMIIDLLCHPGCFVNAKDIDRANAVIKANK